jgi:alpha-L-fucosidase 2
MFIQSHAGFVHFIPALPDAFASGSFRGLRVRGGGFVSAEWKEMRLVKATLTAETNGIFKVKIPEYAGSIITTVDGKKIDLPQEGNLLSVSLKKGNILEIKVL